MPTQPRTPSYGTPRAPDPSDDDEENQQEQAVISPDQPDPLAGRKFDTALSPRDEAGYLAWKKSVAPNDSGDDYDFRGAYKSSAKPDANGHWPDTYKKPNHPTFSEESVYAKDVPELAGRWVNGVYVPPRGVAPVMPRPSAPGTRAYSRPQPVAQDTGPVIGTTGGIVPQQAGTWDKAHAAPQRWADDPAQRRQQAIQRAEADFEAKQRETNPFLFSGAVKSLAKEGGARYIRRAMEDAESDYRRQVDSDREVVIEQRRIEREQRLAGNEQVIQQALATGQKLRKDQFGVYQPILDARGRPLYTPTKWEKTKHPKTGRPMLGMMDQYRQRQFKAPPLRDSTDPLDDHIYADFGEGASEPYMTKEEAAASDDISLKALGLSAIKKQRAAKANERMSGYRRALDESDREFELAQATMAANRQRAQQIALSGGDPAEAAKLEEEAYKLEEQLKPQGPLALRKLVSRVDLELEQAALRHETRLIQRDEIAARVAKTGGALETDPSYIANEAALADDAAKLEQHKRAREAVGRLMQPVAQVATPVAPAEQAGTVTQAGRSFARGATAEGIYAAGEGGARLFSQSPVRRGIEALEDWATEKIQGFPLTPQQVETRKKLRQRAAEKTGSATVDRFARDYAQATSKLREDIRRALPVDQKFAQSLTGQISQGAGQLAGTALTAVATGGTGVAGVSLGQIYDEGYQDAIQSGATPEQAHSAAMKYLPAAAVDTLADRLVVGKLLKPLVGKMTVGQFLKDVLKTGAIEGATEGAQQAYLNQVASKLEGYDPNRPFDKEVLDSFIVGTALGSSATTVGTGARMATQREDAPPPAPPAETVTTEPPPSAGTPGNATDVSPLDAEQARFEEELLQNDTEATTPNEQPAAAPVAPEPALANAEVPAGVATEAVPPAAAVEEAGAVAPAGETPSPLGETVPTDREQYDSIQAQLRELGPEKFDTPEYQALWQASEDIKNRNGGMPPGESSPPVAEPVAVKKAKPQTVTLYHGGPKLDGSLREPAFLTTEKSGAEWYAAERGGDSPTVSEYKAEIGNPLDIDDAEGIKVIIGAAQSAGVPVEITGTIGERGWDFFSPEISKHSDYDGSSVADLAYVPKVRAALKKLGYDAIKVSDMLSNDFIETFIVLDPKKLKATKSAAPRPFEERIAPDAQSSRPSPEQRLNDATQEAPNAPQAETPRPKQKKAKGAKVPQAVGTVAPVAPAPEHQVAPPSTAELRANNAGIGLPPISSLKADQKLAELKAGGITTYAGKPIEDANPAQLSNALGKFRRGELTPEGEKPSPTEPRQSDKIIAALEKAKIGKKGEVFDITAALPVAAYNAALDLAIVAIKAGRTVAEAVQLAVARYKALHKGATEDDISRLRKAVEDAGSPQPPPSGNGPVNDGGNRKESKSKLGKYDYVATSNADQQKFATEFADAHPDIDEAVKEMRGISEPAMRSATAAELLARTMEKWEKASAAEKPALMAKASAIINDVKADKTEAAQALQAQAMVNERLKPFAPLLAWMDLLRTRYQNEVADKVGADAGEKVKQGINQAGDEAATDLKAVLDAPEGEKPAAKNEKALEDWLSKHASTLNLLRKAAKARDLKWGDIFNGLPEEQAARQQELFDRVRQEPKLANLSEASQKKLAQNLDEAWTYLRNGIFKQEFSRLVQLPNIRPVDAAKVRSVIGELIKFSNLGLLDNEAFLSAVAEKYGMERLDGPTATKLTELAGKIQRAKNPAEKAKLELEMLTEFKIAKGVGVVDYAMGTFYANLLSGITTLAVANTGGNLAQTLFNLPTFAAANTKYARNLFRGYRHGFPEALRQAVAIWSTGHGGYDPAAFAVEADKDVLELASTNRYFQELKKKNELLAKSVKGHATVMRYVGRFLRSTDALFFYPSKEAFDWVAAQKILESKYTGADLDKKVRELLEVEPAQFEAIKKQAEAEGFTDHDLSRRISDLLREKRENALGKKEQSESVRRAQGSTLTGDMEGWAGVIAKGVEWLTNKVTPGGVPIGKFILPILRMPTNFYNETLNYTPVGLARSVHGKAVTTKWRDGAFVRRKMTPEERRQLAVKSLIGAAIATSLLIRSMLSDDEDDENYFNITATGPDNAARKAQWRAAGNIPYSIKIGKTSISYETTPLKVVLAIAGRFSDAYKYDQGNVEKWDKVLANAAAFGPLTIFSAPVLQGLGEMATITNAERPNPERAVDFMKRIGTVQAMPRMLTQLDQMFRDDTVKDDGVPRIDSLGEPVRRQPMQRFVSSESDDPVRIALEAKNLSVPGTGDDVTLIPKSGTRKAVEMTPEQRSEYLQFAGSRIKQRLKTMLPLIKALDQEKAQDLVNKISREEKDRAKDYIRIRAMTQATAQAKK